MCAVGKSEMTTSKNMSTCTSVFYSFILVLFIYLFIFFFWIFFLLLIPCTNECSNASKKMGSPGQLSREGQNLSVVKGPSPLQMSK